jgi:methylthioribulose-1-phosphate dehydratase
MVAPFARDIIAPRFAGRIRLPMTTHAGPDPERIATCADAIADAAREFAALGWTPATSSNFSMRLDPAHIAVTVSGRDKGRLGRDDIMVVDMDGHAVGTTLRPSAETALHTQIYRRFADVDAVLHTHSRHQSVASRLYAGDGVVRFQGWELQKAIAGYSSHDSTLELPVFPNTQHMPELTAHVDAWLDAGKPLHGYLIDGHGLYAWGRDMAEARRHLEALEFLLACELDLRRLQG